MITIVDIAKASGVSVGTASRALNGKSNVSENAKNKVLAAAEELHYIPNESARLMKLNDTHSVIIIVKGISNTFFSPIIDMISERLEESDYSIILAPADRVNDIVFWAKKLNCEKNPNGIIFLGGDFTQSIEELKHFPVPFVLSSIGSIDDSMRFKNGSVVGSDDFFLGYLTTEYLILKGHKKIAFLMADPDSAMCKLRKQGCRKAMEDHGIDLNESLIFLAGNTESSFSIEMGYSAVADSINNLEFSALVAFSDTLAFGAVRALKEKNIRVPSDVSVIGMDGTSLARYSVPSITTATVDIDYLADETVKELLSLMRGESNGTICKKQPHIIIGESTSNYIF